jgi:hypothetical protein
MNDDVKDSLSMAIALLEEAKHYAKNGSVGGAAWRVADAGEWLRVAATQEGGRRYGGIHYPTGRGNVFSNIFDDRPVDADFNRSQTVSDVIANNG